jgi:hypothetical protein
MMYPIIHSIAVRTSAPTSAFNGLNRTPEVDDVDSLDRTCGGFGILVLTNTTPTTVDSLALVSIGAHWVDIANERPDNLYGDFSRTKLDPIIAVADQLAGDPHIVTADLELGCAIQGLERVAWR